MTQSHFPDATEIPAFGPTSEICSAKPLTEDNFELVHFGQRHFCHILPLIGLSLALGKCIGSGFCATPISVCWQALRVV